MFPACAPAADRMHGRTRARMDARLHTRAPCSVPASELPLPALPIALGLLRGPGSACHTRVDLHVIHVGQPPKLCHTY